MDDEDRAMFTGDVSAKDGSICSIFLAFRTPPQIFRF